MLQRKRRMPRIFCAEKRPRQDSNLQPRDWSVITNIRTAASRCFANSDPECELIAAA
nr:MAG TPA: hypothetical protein [Caudoviricetes sp.]